MEVYKYLQRESIKLNITNIYFEVNLQTSNTYNCRIFFLLLGKIYENIKMFL